MLCVLLDRDDRPFDILGLFASGSARHTRSPSAHAGNRVRGHSTTITTPNPTAPDQSGAPTAIRPSSSTVGNAPNNA